MKIREVNENKKQFISLLLLADEQENMIGVMPVKWNQSTPSKILSQSKSEG